MSKTLVVSWCVPPAATGSATIMGNLAKQFSPDEMVVVGAYHAGSPAIQWESEWPKLIYAAVEVPSGWRGARWIRWAQLPLVVLAALWVLETQRCQSILAVYPDQVFLFASYIVHVLTRKKLYLYFHNTYVEAYPHSTFARWLQKRVFARAEHVFVMSEGMKKLYESLYPSLPCSPLVHSFTESLPSTENIKLDNLSQIDAPLRFALSGNFGRSNYGAAKHMATVLRNMADVTVHIYSGTDPAYVKEIGFEGTQFEVITVSRDELLRRLVEADILLLPHGFSDTMPAEEIKTIFPTRTIEYLIVGRPILALLPEGCFLINFLRQHQCALIVSEPSEEALIEAINRLKTDADLRAKLIQNALITAKQFQAAAVSDHLRKVLSAHP